MLCVLQLTSEFFVDIACTYKELKAGIPIMAAWAHRSRTWMMRELLQMAEAATILLIAYHVVPYPFFCDSADDVCSCSYASELPAVAAHCWPGGAHASPERDALLQCVEATTDVCGLNVTSCLPGCAA